MVEKKTFCVLAQNIFFFFFECRQDKLDVRKKMFCALAVKIFFFFSYCFLNVDKKSCGRGKKCPVP